MKCLSSLTVSLCLVRIKKIEYSNDICHIRDIINVHTFQSWRKINPHRIRFHLLTSQKELMIDYMPPWQK